MKLRRIAREPDFTSTTSPRPPFQVNSQYYSIGSIPREPSVPNGNGLTDRPYSTRTFANNLSGLANGFSSHIGIVPCTTRPCLGRCFSNRHTICLSRLISRLCGLCGLRLNTQQACQSMKKKENTRIVTFRGK